MFSRNKERQIVEKLREEQASKDRKVELIRIMAEADIIRQGINTPFWELICKKVEESTLPESKNLKPEDIIAMTPETARLIMLIGNYKEKVIGLPAEILKLGEEAEKAYRKDYTKEEVNNA